jgi:hypothetical protein
MSPSWTPDQKGVKVQIVDVFALRLATGYEKDATGRLLLQSEDTVAQGRTWSLAKACQLVRNDTKPNRWVVLHRHKKAWGLFWAGGGLDLCRDELAKEIGTELAGAIVPATPEALLRLVLALDESSDTTEDWKDKSKKEKRRGRSIAAQTEFPWRAIVITSSIWLVALVALGINSNYQLQQQNNKLQILLERFKGQP